MHIQQTDEWVRAWWGPLGVRRIGGDTDSLLLYVPVEMLRVRFPDLPDDDHRVVAMGREMVDRLNREYPPPMNIELDDVYRKFIYLKKKHYAGSYWLPAGPTLAPNGVKIQGLECKRLDWPPIIADTQRDCLRCLLGLPVDVVGAGAEEGLCETPVEKAVRVLRNAVRLVKQNQVPDEGYFFSKELRSKEYKTVQMHTRIWERLKVSDPEGAPAPGDRLRFVKVRACGRVEGYAAEELRALGVRPCRQTLLDEMRNVMRRTLEVVMPVARVDGYFAEGAFRAEACTADWFSLGKRRKINKE
jgi:DNA polymerase elongation subunit (family B)